MVRVSNVPHPVTAVVSYAQSEAGVKDSSEPGRVAVLADRSLSFNPSRRRGCALRLAGREGRGQPAVIPAIDHEA